MLTYSEAIPLPLRLLGLEWAMMPSCALCLAFWLAVGALALS